MKNSKKKKIIIGLVIILCLALGGLTYMIINYTNSHNNTNKDNSETTENNNQNQEENNKNDLHSKYPNIEWADTVGTIQINATDIEEVLRIEDGNLVCLNSYSRYNNYCDYINSNKTSDIKKLTIFQDIYGDTIYLLTTNNKVYRVKFLNNFTIENLLDDINVEDMTIPYRNYRTKTTHVDIGWYSLDELMPYFLTNEGTLISLDKTLFEEDNKDFVNSICFNNPSDYSTMLCLYYNQDRLLSYRGEKNNSNGLNHFDCDDNYVEALNKNNERLVAKYLYDSFENGDYGKRKILIVDPNDEIYSIDNGYENFNVKYIGKLVNFSVISKPSNYNDEPYVIDFNLSDGSKYEFYSYIDSYFDVKENKEIKF